MTARELPSIGDEYIMGEGENATKLYVAAMEFSESDQMLYLRMRRQTGLQTMNKAAAKLSIPSPGDSKLGLTKRPVRDDPQA